MKISVDENIRLRFKFLSEEENSEDVKRVLDLLTKFDNVEIIGTVVNPETFEKIVGIEIKK